MQDRKEFIVSFLATVRIGCVALLMNPAIPPQLLADTVKRCLCRVVISEDQFAKRILPEFECHNNEIFVFVKSVRDTTQDDVLKSILLPDSLNVQSWEELTIRKRVDGVVVDVCATTADSPCYWLCTSGTTGVPKVVMHCHIDMKLGSESYGEHVLSMSFDRPDVSFSSAPMFHAYGFGNSINFPLSFGGTVIVEPNRPLFPARIAEILTTHRPSLFYSVPSGFSALLHAELSPDVFSSVRATASAGEPLPGAVFDQFAERYGLHILDGIGSSEVSNFYCSNRVDAPRKNSCGTPLPGHDIQLRDESGRVLELAVGCRGEMFVSAPSAATGYYCDTAKSRKTFVGPYVATGDMFEFIEGGHFKVAPTPLIIVSAMCFFDMLF